MKLNGGWGGGEGLARAIMVVYYPSGGRPFCTGIIFKILHDLFCGSFSEKGALLLESRSKQVTRVN